MGVNQTAGPVREWDMRLDNGRESLNRGHWLLAHLCALAVMAAGVLTAVASAPVSAAQPGDKASSKTSVGTVSKRPAAKEGAAVRPTVRAVVRVIVTGLRNNSGVVYCKLHDRRTTYPTGKHASIRPTKARPAGLRAVCTYRNIPHGRYAVVIAHDENGNGKIDSNWIGIPKEGYGFSNNVVPLFSAPGFDSAGFKVARDVTVTIRVIYR